MMLKTNHVLIISIMLLGIGVLTYIYYKPSIELASYVGDLSKPKVDVCTEECLEAVKAENDQILKDCLVNDRMSQEKAEDKVSNLETKNENQRDFEAEILVLVWVWPFGERFPFDTCEPLFGVKNCRITDDRSQYENAHGVLFHLRDIYNQIPTLKKLPRFPLQMWVWMNNESPDFSPRLSDGEDLFNLTSNYRRDSDIWSPYGRVYKATEEEKAFQIPKKDKLVCWIVSHWDDNFPRVKYFNELSKHVNVDGFGNHFGRRISNEDYFNVIRSCKFYLSFENSIYKDYISEKVYNPLVLGTVPVVIGPPRDNYEEFIPQNAFIHIDDFKTPQDLAEHLKLADQNQEIYESYFDWRKHFVAKLGHPEEHACRTCEYIRMNRNFRSIRNINKWYFG
ncbi:4-galactosyl-N-acetylglucosaminide 3-alpha-L-fucosyltransferase 9-like [Hoplias malabaricus]|uniref:4-galactosyl-N-acetylglucosaminide 3-alpha-L-fucosyltransferase 9-like n=1 Tax=Hoplias malabaricus TaxID=27720 RepID=UPI0034630B42